MWNFLTRPLGSTAVLTAPTTPFPRFTPDVSGTYRVRLVVNDGQSSSLADTVIVSTVNGPPVANAGPDQKFATAPQSVQLDGTRSTDDDEQLLHYNWSIVAKPSSSSAVLSDPTDVKPIFGADVEGTYVIRLVVTDGLLASAPELVRVIVGGNTAPIADAGPDQFATVRQVVRLNAAGSSDADGNELGFRWALLWAPAGSTTVLFNVTAVRPAFVPDRPGTYIAQLVATDGRAISEPDTVVITTDNVRPVANAGADQTIHVGVAAILDGTGSTDANGDVLLYHWTIASRPRGSSVQILRDVPVTTLVPDVDGVYVVNLQVSDGTLTSDRDTIVISTFDSDAVASVQVDSEQVPVGTNVTLNGRQSFDVDGVPITFTWSLLVRPHDSLAAISNPTDPVAFFPADTAGTYIAQLIVTSPAFLPNGVVIEDSRPATVLIVATPRVNHAPVANAGANQVVSPGQTVSLDGGGSFDPDGDTLRYSWSLKPAAGSAATLDDPTSQTPSFIVDVDGVYTATLVVRDAQISSAAATVVITTAALVVDPTTIDFGEQEVGTPSATRFVTLTSTGTGGVSVIPFSTSTAFPVTAESTCIGLIPQTGCTVAVVFSPFAEGATTAQINITATAIGASQTVTVTGIGVRRSIAVDPTLVDFGDQDVGTTSVARAVTVQANGSGFVDIGSIVTAGSFAIVSDGCSGLRLAAGTNCVLSVVFTPGASGPNTGMLSIPSNATGSPHHAALTGNGLVRQVTISPTAIDYKRGVALSGPPYAGLKGPRHTL